MALIQVEHVSKRFPLPDGKGDFSVLGDVSLSVRSGEVVALLGRSGSGKSTLLRIMAGLIQPSQGQVLSHGTPLRGTNRNLAMVFQSFALLPWLSVQENVELGLAARHVPRAERAERALRAIDLVGLDGFENAYPKELSGGMKQRVGFARAFVLEPEVLFMDEPFSALDVLTAENLRGEIDDLWNAGTFPSRSILIVTHNIEEAIFLADRVVILSANPGRIRGELRINLPRPHDRSHPRFKALVDYVYTVMTNPDIAVTGELEDDQVVEVFIEREHSRGVVGNIYKGRVVNIESSIQAVFVDFGIGRNGFLHVSDVEYQYYKHLVDPDAEAKARKAGKRFNERSVRNKPPIQEIFKRGSEVLVQVIKGAIGSKGPTLSTYISIPGRYLVLMPGLQRVGVSRKIADDDARKRLPASDTRLASCRTCRAWRAARRAGRR